MALSLNLYSMTFSALTPLRETIFVTRRPAKVNQSGRNVLGMQTFPRVKAYVTSTTPDDLDRNPDYSTTSRSIEVFTNFPLMATAQAAEQGYQPDEVTWHGTNYMVTKVEDFSKLRAGYVKALCESKLGTDPPPMLP